MKKIFYIAQKEWISLFQSPMAYIILLITTCVFNLFFFLILDQAGEASLREIFRTMEFMFVFIVPILTMRVVAEEKHSGTLEFLMTAPLKNYQIIGGKYLGLVFFFSLILALTFPYYFVLEHFGNVDTMTTLWGYLGIWLEGLLFLAIGLMTSSWTRHQVVAAISSYAILFLFYLSMVFIQYFNGPIEGLIKRVGFMTHSENFFIGLLQTSDLVYFVSGIVVCLVLSTVSIKNRE